MNNLNSVLIEGDLTRDPVQATTPEGIAVTSFTIRSYRSYPVDGDIQKEISFFDVQVCGRLAERCGEELKKDRGVRVVGCLRQDRWDDKDGRPRSRVKIIGEHVEFRHPATQTPDAGGTE